MVGRFFDLLFSKNCQKYVFPWLTIKSELLDALGYYSVKTIVKSIDFWGLLFSTV
jgi:hypothetical protein